MPQYYGRGLAHEDELFFLSGPDAAFWKARKPVPSILYCHGAGGIVLSKENNAKVIRELSRAGFLVLVSDWGGKTFGYTPSNSRVEEGRIALQQFNVNPDAPIGILGISMGATVGLNYTRINQDKVGYFGGIIPLLDLENLKIRNPSDLGDSLDNAFGGSYSDAVHGQYYSPVRYASTLRTDLPVHLWIGANDNVIPRSTSTAFMAAHSNTVREIYEVPDVTSTLGDHSSLVQIEALDSIVQFCKDHAQT